MSAETPPSPQLSPDGRFYWDGTRWEPADTRVEPGSPASAEQDPSYRRPGALVPAVYVVAGGLTLFLSLFAVALGGDTGPTAMDLVVLASWVALAIALVAGGVGLALGKGWTYWIRTVGVLAPSAIYPWSLLQSSQSLVPNSSAAIGPGSAPPQDAVVYYYLFLATLVVALVAIGFRHSWVRFLAIPGIIFMAISCFELPAAAALVAGLGFSVKPGQASGFFKGLRDALAAATPIR